MFGMGGMDPKKMQAVMSKMGISQKEIDATKVTIEKTDGSNIVINNPSISIMTIQGQDMFQIQGDAQESTPEVGISQDDIDIIVEKTGKTAEEAKEALEKTGDLTEAIMQLS